MRKTGWASCLVIGLGLLGAGLFLQKARAQFGGPTYCINCASEITALVQKATQLMQYTQEAQTALQSIQMARMMVQNGLNLLTHPSVNVTQDLMTLQSVLMSSQGLAGTAAQIDHQFNSLYSPFIPGMGMDYSASYGSWAKGTLNTIQGTLRNAGMQSNVLQNQQLWLQQVELMSQTPMGQNQSIQLGNAIGLQTVKSLMSLQQILTQDTVAKQAVAAQSLNVSQARQAASQNAFYYAGVNADTRTW